MVTQTPEGKTVFQFYRPDARHVTIAGDFNGWQPSFHMVRARDGWWRSSVELAPGTYRFRYLADGQWYTDYAAFGVEPGPYGFNSVLKVDPAEAPLEAESVTAAEPAAVVLEAPARQAAAQVPVERRQPVTPQPQRQRPEPATPVRQLRRRPALVD